uniref:Uncharacterized protein n=1 Tax=Timema douglasi TaxID=61478 RepID=A0A7R8Z7A7_TIMDO|nr:unnamed protein product [Timema douglasi]
MASLVLTDSSQLTSDSQHLAPGFPCNNDDECVRGAACISPNSTRATGQKLCRCKHEDDDEDDDECSSALRTVTSISLVSALVLLAASHVLTSAI